MLLHFFSLMLFVNCSSSSLDLFLRFHEVTELFDAFGENSTMQHAVEKVDILADLGTKILELNVFPNLEAMHRLLCKLYNFQLLMHTGDPAVYKFIKTLFKSMGLLEKPFNSSLLRKRRFGNFRDSSALLRQSDAFFNKIFMRNMVLKFDNPLKTGL